MFSRKWLLALLLFSPLYALSQVSSVQDGDWDDPNTWDCACVPDFNNGDISVIHNVDIPAAFSVQVANLFIGDGSSGNLVVDGDLTVAGGTIFVTEDFSSVPIFVVGSSGSLTINTTGILDLSSGLIFTPCEIYGDVFNSGSIQNADPSLLFFQSNSAYYHRFTTGGDIPLATYDQQSLVEINDLSSASPAAPNNLNQTFGDFTWNCPTMGTTTTFHLGGQLQSVAGDLVFQTSNSRSIRLNSGGAVTNLSVGGNLDNRGVALIIANNNTGSAVIDITGDLLMSQAGSPIPSITMAVGSSASVQINLAGNFSRTAGTFNKGTSSGTATLQFNGPIATTRTYSWTGTGNITSAIQYIISSNSVLDVGTSILSGSGSLTVNGTLRLGSLHTSGALQNTTTIDADCGNVTTTTRTFNSGSTLVYAGSGPQFLGNGHPSASNITTQIINASGVTLASDVSFGGNLTLTTGNLSIGTFTLTLNGSFTPNSNSLNVVAGSSIAIGGSGAFGTLILSGSSTINNLTLNRVSSGTVTLGSNLGITGTFTQTQGNVILNGRTLTLSGPYVRTNGSFAIDAASGLVIDGAGALPSQVAFAAPQQINTLTLDRSAEILATSSSFTVTNLNLLSGTFNNTGTITMATGGVLTRTEGSLINNTPQAQTTYDVVYDISSDITTGSELPLASGLRNLTKDGAATLNFDQSVILSGNLTITNGIFNLAGNDIELAGNLIANSASQFAGSDIIFAGTSSISGSAALNLENVTIANSASVTLSKNLGVTGNFQNNGSFNANTQTVTFSGTSTISGSSTTTFAGVTISGTLTAPASPGSFAVSGNWTNNGTFNNNNSSITFNGSTIIAGSNQSNFFNVTISGTLTAPTGTLGIAGNLTNSGTFNSNSGTVLFNGTINPQTVSGSAITFNNITVSNPITPGLQITNASRLNGTLTLNTGAFMDADGPSGTGIFIVSSTSQTVGGRIATLPNPTNLTGQVTIERYVHGKTGGDYRYLSMPITTNANLSIWRNSIHVTGNFSDRSTNADNANIVDSGNTNPSVNSFNSTTQAFTPINGTGGLTSATILSSRIGYSAYDFNDGPVTVSYRGVPERGNVPITISNSNGNFNLVPNPYPSPLDWDNVVKTNVNNAMYLRVDNNVFSSYVGGVATNAPFIGWSGEISTGQSFWVVSNGGGTTFTLREADKTGNNNYFLRTKSPEDYFRISLNAVSGRSDEIVIRFADNASDEYDVEWDAFKLKNDQLKNPTTFETRPSFNLSSYVTNPMEEYAINSVAKLTGEKIINLNVADVEPGEYVLKFSDLSMLTSGYRVVLVDLYGRKETDITDGSEYAFQITEEEQSIGMGRFYLRINGEQAKDFPPYLTEIQVYPNPTTDYVYIELSEVERDNLKSITLLNAMGASLSQENYDSTIRPSGKQVLDLREKPAGLYLIAIQLGEEKKVIRVLKR